MRVSPRLSGRARAWSEGFKRPSWCGAGAPGPFAVERLEARTLLSVGAGEGVGLGEVLRPAMTLVPVRRRDSVTSGAPGYQIEVNFVGAVTPSQQAAFSAAANRWQQVITGEIPDVQTDAGFVDDIRIDASAPVIDGPGGILGMAGPTELRSDGSYLPVRGQMEFDSADLATLEAQGQLVNVILHEMGHVLGFGTIWSFKNLVTGTGGPDPRFIGPNATAEFNSIFSMEAASVPVENTGGPGTQDAHWRESVFDNELMTGFLDGGRPNLLSRVTAAQFIDLGYPGVVVSAADAYSPPSVTPGAPDLLPGFDSGLSNADDLTRLDNSAAGSALQFSVPGTVAGATVTILADGAPVGSAVAAGPTTVVATNGSSDLPDGVRSITARQTEPGKELSAASPALAVTVDTVAPRVNSFAFLFQSSPHRLTYGFSESVQASLAAADLTVWNLMSGDPVGLSGPAYDAGTNVATFSFGGVLPNAHYAANMAKAGVTDAAGNPLPVDHFFKFFSLTGDVNRDRLVNGSDFAILAGNFGKSGQAYAAGDLNGDGSVNGTDFQLLASNFGQRLPAIPALVAASASQRALVQPVAAAPSAPAPALLLPQPVRPTRRTLPPKAKQPAGIVRRLAAPLARPEHRR
jgi:hypothetical protein